MGRKIELNKEGFRLSEAEAEGFLERVITPLGNFAKADIPKNILATESTSSSPKTKTITIKQKQLKSN